MPDALGMRLVASDAMVTGQSPEPGAVVLRRTVVMLHGQDRK